MRGVIAWFLKPSNIFKRSVTGIPFQEYSHQRKPQPLAFSSVAQYCEGIKEYNKEAKENLEFAEYLRKKIRNLDNGRHAGEAETRKEIVGRYYEAYIEIANQIENGEIRESSVVGDIKIFRVESSKEEAKGVAVIAKKGDQVVGRMFIARGTYHDHLSILSVKNNVEGYSQMTLLLNMLESYLDVKESEEIKSRMIIRSCIGDYDPSIRDISGGGHFSSEANNLKTLTAEKLCNVVYRRVSEENIIKRIPTTSPAIQDDGLKKVLMQAKDSTMI